MDGPGAPDPAQRVAIVGTPREATAALEMLRFSRAELVGIVAHPEPSDRAPGLAMLHSRARATGVPVLSPRGATLPAALQWLAHLALDYVVCTGWSALLTDDMFRVPRHGVLGLARRASPSDTRLVLAPDWAVLRGGTLTGHVLLVLLPAAAGPTAAADGSAQLREEGADAAAPDVYEELARTGLRLLETERADAAIGRSAGTSLGALDDAMPPPLGLTSFDRPAAEVHDWVQAMSRCGTGAFAVLRGEVLLIWDCEPAWGDDRRLPPGTVLGADTGVVVSARGGGLRLLWVQEPARVAEPAAEWFARKARPPGCAFEPVDWSPLAWLRP